MCFGSVSFFAISLISAFLFIISFLQVYSTYNFQSITFIFPHKFWYVIFYYRYILIYINDFLFFWPSSYLECYLIFKNIYF